MRVRLPKNEARIKVAVAARPRLPPPTAAGRAAGLPAALLQLQRTHGNRFVQRLINERAAARKCACGGPVAHGGECAECRREKLPIQRRPIAGGAVAAVEIPRSVDDTLRSGGEPLDSATRGLMESRFGYDFGRVRIHRGGRAAESARALHARAYTAGRDVVFGPGQYEPWTARGRRLLAHELTHVVQQSAPGVARPAPECVAVSDPSDEAEKAAERTATHVMNEPASREAAVRARSGLSLDGVPLIQRESAGPDAPAGAANKSEPAPAADDVKAPGQQADPGEARQSRLQSLLSQIASQTAESATLRGQLNALPPDGLKDREKLEQELAGKREALITLLAERTRLLDEEVAALEARLASPPPGASKKEAKALDQQLRQQVKRRMAERREHEGHLRVLSRWQERREITSIQNELARLDEQLGSFSFAGLAGRIWAGFMLARRAELEQRKTELARAMTSSAYEYEQFDARWAKKTYGAQPECTTMKKAGCGPTTLAIVLNYLYHEDPESLAAKGEMEIVTPPQTAEYAAKYGRVCPGGTLGNSMVTHVHTNWPGFVGRSIDLEQAAEQLRGGNLVIFLCSRCTGQLRGGGDKSYKGHFMVLNGVNAEGTAFDVLDPGGNRTTGILTISHAELEKHASGFWIIERK